MQRAEIFSKLNEIFCDVFDDTSITVKENTVAQDIEDWDSLSHISLISAIESEFHFKFEMKDVLGMKDVGEMVDIIERSID